MNSPAERVRQCLAAHGVAGPIVVAVSGGPDSVCLLHILGQFQEEMGLKLHVAHLNHRLQPQAQAHARYVSRLCRRLNIPAVIEARDVAAYRQGHRLSLEEAARQVRYAFLAEVAKDNGARWVLTGHTADDQVETVLMHLLRGTGCVGLQGMAQAGAYPYATGGPLRLLRPLLTTTRAETESYCRAYRLRPRQDPSNAQLSLLRNRVRRQLLPTLEKYNPRLREGLLRLAQMARDQVSLLDGLVDAVWPNIVSQDAGGLRLSSTPLLQQPRAVRQHLFRRAVERVAGSFTDFEVHHMERLEAALEAGAGRRIPLPHGLRATTEHRAIYLSLHPTSPLPPLEGEHRLRVPGETALPGWRVVAVLRPSREGLRRMAGVEASPQGWPFQGKGWQAQISYEARTPLWVRARRPGDRFQPLGMAQAKKLQDFMVDAHIPRDWRSRVPLVCSPQGIIWVVGYRLAEAARVTARTKQVLALEFERRESR